MPNLNGAYTACPTNIVFNAIRLNWTPEQLSWSFHGMDCETAAFLLEGAYVIDEHGTVSVAG